MRLLVSVQDAAEASAALAGNADIIDAKNPHAGALGAVSLPVLHDIHGAIGGVRPVSAALGDASDEAVVERDARAFVAAGARFVKIGFAGISSAERVQVLLEAAVRGARAGAAGRRKADATLDGVIAVSYADGDAATSIAFTAFADVAARAGARGILLDTANKRGPGLRALVAPRDLAAWVSAAHTHGLLVALAGQLTADDLQFAGDAGADIAGVRGAACDQGRTGRVTAERVRALQTRMGSIRSA